MTSRRTAGGFVAPKMSNRQGTHPRVAPAAQTPMHSRKAPATAGWTNKVNKRQRKMAEKRMAKLSDTSALSTHMTARVAKSAIPAPTKTSKKIVEKKVIKAGFLTFSPFDSRFPVFFESYSPWDARFPHGAAPKPFPSFSPFDSRFPVDGNGLFRNIYVAKQEEKAAAARRLRKSNSSRASSRSASKRRYVDKPATKKAQPSAKSAKSAKAVVSKPATKQSAAKPAGAAAKPATQLPAAAFAPASTVSSASQAWAAFPRFSPMARTGATAAVVSSGRSAAAPAAQSPLSAMRARANGNAAASPTVRRPHPLR